MIIALLLAVVLTVVISFLWYLIITIERDCLMIKFGLTEEEANKAIAESFSRNRREECSSFHWPTLF